MDASSGGSRQIQRPLLMRDVNMEDTAGRMELEEYD
jgi:hypothetical protein